MGEIQALCVTRKERLVTWARAASVLGRSPDTLTNWFEQGLVPAVRTPGQRLSTYASWLDAVLASARPGQAGDVAEVTRQWWDEHLQPVPVLEAVS
jgi:hypothetical protein